MAMTTVKDPVVWLYSRFLREMNTRMIPQPHVTMMSFSELSLLSYHKYPQKAEDVSEDFFTRVLRERSPAVRSNTTYRCWERHPFQLNDGCIDAGCSFAGSTNSWLSLAGKKWVLLRSLLEWNLNSKRFFAQVLFITWHKFTPPNKGMFQKVKCVLHMQRISSLTKMCLTHQAELTLLHRSRRSWNCFGETLIVL